MGTRRTRALRALGAAALAALAFTQSAQATYPGANGRLAFDMPNGEVRTILPNGTAENVRFTDSRYRGHLNYGWAGTLLAWTGNTGATNGGFVQGVGSGVATVPNTAPGGDYMALSPDGGWAAFSAERDGSDREIYASRLDGGDTLRLIPDPTPDAPRWDIYPEWSPDGTKIVYMRLEPSGYKLRLFNLATRSNTELATTTKAASPSFSPDGTKIAYLDAGSGGDNTWGQIYIKNLASSGIGTAVPGAYGIEPAFSPDGTKLAFVEQSDGRHIVTMNLDGSARTYVRRESWRFDLMANLAWAQDCRVGPIGPRPGGGVVGPALPGGGIVGPGVPDVGPAIAEVVKALTTLDSFPYVELPVSEVVRTIGKYVDAPLTKEVQAALPAELRDLRTAVERQLEATPKLPGTAAGALKSVAVAAGELAAKLDENTSSKPPCPPRPAEPPVRQDPKAMPLILVKGYQGHIPGVSDRKASANAGASCAAFNQLKERFRSLGYTGAIEGAMYLNGDTQNDGNYAAYNQDGPSRLSACTDLSGYQRPGANGHDEHWGKAWDCDKPKAYYETWRTWPFAPWPGEWVQHEYPWSGDCPTESTPAASAPPAWRYGFADQQDGPDYQADPCRRWSLLPPVVACDRETNWTHYAKDSTTPNPHSDNTPNQHIAYHLAWMIYERYSRNGIAVNIISHSMGGLQVRYMLQEVRLQQQESSLAERNFPPYLLINEVTSVDSTQISSSPSSRVGCDNFGEVLTGGGAGLIATGQDFQCLQQDADADFEQKGNGIRVSQTGGATPQTAPESHDLQTQWAAMGSGDDIIALREDSLPTWVDFHIGYCGTQTGPRKLLNGIVGQRNVQIGNQRFGGTDDDGDRFWSEPGEAGMGSQFDIPTGWQQQHPIGGPPATEATGHFYYLRDFGSRPFRLNRFTYTNTRRSGGRVSRRSGPASQQDYGCAQSSKLGPQPLDMVYAATTRKDM